MAFTIPDDEDEENDTYSESLSFLTGIVDNKDIPDLYNDIECYRNRMPNGFLPIGDDGFGNVICLSLDEKEYGWIYFWDHEMEEKPADYSNCSKIADSFTDFMNSLKPIEE